MAASALFHCQESFSALQVADRYFRAGADKVSIGSDAVAAAQTYYKNEKKCTGDTGIRQISKKYGNQAVVVSVDPKRVYTTTNLPDHSCVKLSDYSMENGPNGEEYCWYACTIKGGRELTDMDVIRGNCC